MDNMIYSIRPAESPFFAFVRYARVKVAPGNGQSMRKRRRRMAKPARLTLSSKAKSRSRVEWHIDKPAVV